MLSVRGRVWRMLRVRRRVCSGGRMIRCRRRCVRRRGIRRRSRVVGTATIGMNWRVAVLRRRWLVPRGRRTLINGVSRSVWLVLVSCRSVYLVVVSCPFVCLVVVSCRRVWFVLVGRSVWLVLVSCRSVRIVGMRRRGVRLVSRSCRSVWMVHRGRRNVWLVVTGSGRSVRLVPMLGGRVFGWAMVTATLVWR